MGTLLYGGWFLFAAIDVGRNVRSSLPIDSDYLSDVEWEKVQRLDTIIHDMMVS